METNMKECLGEEGSTHKPAAADTISLVFKTRYLS